MRSTPDCEAAACELLSCSCIVSACEHCDIREKTFANLVTLPLSQCATPLCVPSMWRSPLAVACGVRLGFSYSDAGWQSSWIRSTDLNAIWSAISGCKEMEKKKKNGNVGYICADIVHLDSTTCCTEGWIVCFNLAQLQLIATQKAVHPAPACNVTIVRPSPTWAVLSNLAIWRFWSVFWCLPSDSIYGYVLNAVLHAHL